MAFNINEKTGIRYGVIGFNDLTGEGMDEIFSRALPETLTEQHEDQAPNEDTPQHYSNMGIVATLYPDSATIIISESPYLAYTSFCSPCYPNAGDLTSTGRLVTYSLPSEWFKP